MTPKDFPISINLPLKELWFLPSWLLPDATVITVSAVSKFSQCFEQIFLKCLFLWNWKFHGTHWLRLKLFTSRKNLLISCLWQSNKTFWTLNFDLSQFAALSTAMMHTISTYIIWKSHSWTICSFLFKVCNRVLIIFFVSNYPHFHNVYVSKVQRNLKTGVHSFNRNLILHFYLGCFVHIILKIWGCIAVYLNIWGCSALKYPC